MVASVTMNAGIFTRPMSTPLNRPHKPPATRANSSVRNTLSVALNTTTEKLPTSASMEPTDRSMPPVMMTRPMPKAMMPTTAECRRMFITPLHVVAPWLINR